MTNDIKIACAGWGYREKSLEGYLKSIKSLGIPNVEINCGHEEAPLHLHSDMRDQEIAKVGDMADKYGIEIVALAAANDFVVSQRKLDSRLKLF